MALIYLDPCGDDYDTGTAVERWTRFGGLVVAGFTGNAIQMSSGLTSLLTFGPIFNKVCFGFRYQVQIGGFNNPLAMFQSAGAIGDFVTLSHAGGGVLQVERAGDGPTALPNPIVVGTWYYIEFIVDCGAKSMDVYIDGVKNGATVNFATPFLDIAGFLIAGPGGGPTSLYDDIYLTDGEILGPLTVQVLFVRAPGTTDHWDPSSGTSTVAMVRKTVPNGFGSFVSGLAVADVSRYFMDNIISPKVILGAQALRSLAKSDAGPVASVIPDWRNSGGTVITDPANYFPAASDFTYQRRAFRVSPWTGVNFTRSEINSAQLGLERAS